ncbi:MAG TPA: ThiF family adenylyltransferase [Methylobacter sp.]
MKKKVIILGVGALGSHVTYLLRNEADLKVCDFDRIEMKNVLAQFHFKGSVSKNKAIALKDGIKFLFGKVIEAVPYKFDLNNVKEICSNTDLVIDCFDNGESRRLVQDYCHINRKPCLHGALSADGTFGRVIWNEEFRIDDEPKSGTPTCEGGEHLPFISIVSGFIAKAAQEFLTSKKKVSYNVYSGGAKQV